MIRCEIQENIRIFWQKGCAVTFAPLHLPRFLKKLLLKMFKRIFLKKNLQRCSGLLTFASALKEGRILRLRRQRAKCSNSMFTRRKKGRESCLKILRAPEVELSLQSLCGRVKEKRENEERPVVIGPFKDKSGDRRILCSKKFIDTVRTEGKH
ncbi:MAG: hypothetical protein J5I98_27845 [Phaeodactylibacter sp.]|nr:hypothetical protein [Phaeodactylibacter sp.]